MGPYISQEQVAVMLWLRLPSHIQLPHKHLLTLTYVFVINRPHIFTIKLEWFYNRKLNWKAHLFYILDPGEIILICRQVPTDLKHFRVRHKIKRHPCILLKIIPAVYQRLHDHGVEHWRFSIKIFTALMYCLLPRLWKEIKITGNWQHFICIKTWAKIKRQILPFQSSNGWILIKFPNKVAAAIARLSFLVSWNLKPRFPI